MALDFYQAMGSGGLNFQTPLQSTAPKQQAAPTGLMSSYGNVSAPMSTSTGMVGPKTSRGSVLGDTTIKPGGAGPVQTTQPTSDLAPPTPQGPSGEEIDSVYNPSMQYLDQAEGQLRNDFVDVQTQADRDYQILINQLGGSRDTNLAITNENETKSGQIRDDAMSAARRLYDELRRGYQQRFGGSTSAGQAASEISSVEQQRQMGQTQKVYGDTVRQIEGQRMQIQKDYQDGALKLEQNKQIAVATAQRDFQNKLLEISNNRTQIESAKASARLDALQQLRNSVYQIQLQTFEFERALAQQKQLAETDLQNTYSRFGQQAQESSNTLANAGFNTTPSTNLQTGSNQSPATQGLTGQISASRKFDEYGRPIYG